MISLDSKALELRFRTEDIELATNKFTRNHRLGLTQTLEKSNHSQEKKGENEERKSQTKSINPRGHEEDSGLHSHTKISEIHHEFFRFLDLSQEH